MTGRTPPLLRRSGFSPYLFPSRIFSSLCVEDKCATMSSSLHFLPSSPLEAFCLPLPYSHVRISPPLLPKTPSVFRMIPLPFHVVLHPIFVSRRFWSPNFRPPLLGRDMGFLFFFYLTPGQERGLDPDRLIRVLSFDSDSGLFFFRLDFKRPTLTLRPL